MSLTKAFKHGTAFAKGMEKQLQRRYLLGLSMWGEEIYTPGQEQYFMMPNGKAASVAGIETDSDLEMDDVQCRFCADRRWRCWAIKMPVPNGVLISYTDEDAQNRLVLMSTADILASNSRFLHDYTEEGVPYTNWPTNPVYQKRCTVAGHDVYLFQKSVWSIEKQERLGLLVWDDSRTLSEFWDNTGGNGYTIGRLTFYPAPNYDSTYIYSQNTYKSMTKYTIQDVFPYLNPVQSYTTPVHTPAGPNPPSADNNHIVALGSNNYIYAYRWVYLGNWSNGGSSTDTYGYELIQINISTGGITVIDSPSGLNSSIAAPILRSSPGNPYSINYSTLAFTHSGGASPVVTQTVSDFGARSCSMSHQRAPVSNSGQIGYLQLMPVAGDYTWFSQQDVSATRDYYVVNSLVSDGRWSAVSSPYEADVGFSYPLSSSKGFPNEVQFLQGNSFTIERQKFPMPSDGNIIYLDGTRVDEKLKTCLDISDSNNIKGLSILNL